MSGVTTYTQEIADSICESIADGKSLREICKADDMPSRATVFKWLNDIEGFSDQYARAREEQAETLADEIISIIDQAAEPLMVEGVPLLADGKPILIASQVSVAHARLKMDARKWVASKLKPKKYGDKVEVDNKHSGIVAVSLSETDEKL
jgi:hypothetical protein